MHHYTLALLPTVIFSIVCITEMNSRGGIELDERLETKTAVFFFIRATVGG